MVTPVDKLEVRGCAIPFVGRGGLKLARALEVWGIDLSGLRCVDAGASTGGFTDCMLQAGAAHVWSIDVGHDQLHESLVADERVTSLEGLDIRLATPELLGAEADFWGRTSRSSLWARCCRASPGSSTPGPTPSAS